MNLGSSHFLLRRFHGKGAVNFCCKSVGIDKIVPSTEQQDNNEKRLGW